MLVHRQHDGWCPPLQQVTEDNHVVHAQHAATVHCNRRAGAGGGVVRAGAIPPTQGLDGLGLVGTGGAHKQVTLPKLIRGGSTKKKIGPSAGISHIHVCFKKFHMYLYAHIYIFLYHMCVTTQEPASRGRRPPRDWGLSKKIICIYRLILYNRLYVCVCVYPGSGLGAINACPPAGTPGPQGGGVGRAATSMAGNGGVGTTIAWPSRPQEPSLCQAGEARMAR